MLTFSSRPSNHAQREQKTIEKDQPRVLLIDSDGLSQYSSYLARGLAKYRDVIFYGFSKDDYIITGAENDNRIKFYWIGEKLPRRTLLVRLIGQPLVLISVLLKALLTETKYDIVHVQGHLPMFFLFIPLLRIMKIKLYWTLHDVTLMPTYNGIKGRMELLYVRLTTQPNIMTKYADIIMVHGLFLKKYLESKGINKNKIHVIPHFDYRYLLNCSSDSNNCKEHGSIIKSNNTGSSKKDYILFFGHITQYKGINVLINAAKIARKRVHNDTSCILIAGKGDTSCFDELLLQGDRKYIHVLNKFITSPEIPEILRNAKFLVLPYTKAFKYSVSGVIPLAYTFSKPVIVSNVGSLAEYVDHGKTGFIFEEGNAEELADYIIQLLQDNSKCVEMGKRGYQKMMEEMSLERCCEIINGLYKENQHQ
jgi:alpha-maltose-1-phosphate synthase